MANESDPAYEFDVQLAGVMQAQGTLWAYLINDGVIEKSKFLTYFTALADGLEKEGAYGKAQALPFRTIIELVEKLCKS
jgi:hypothetical protein